MNESNQTHVTKLLRRKSSFDDYQRRLVDKIKRHFERRRKQWENNIENQVQHRQGEAKVTTTTNINHQQPALEEEGQEGRGEEGDQVYINIDKTSETTLHSGKESNTRTTVFSTSTLTKSEPSKDESQQITIISTESTDFPDEGKTKYTFIVDIKFFLPFGSVTVCQEDKGLMLIGETNCSSCRSRGRRGLVRNHERMIDIGGVLENDSMKVHTTREGIMRIDIVASNSNNSSKS